MTEESLDKARRRLLRSDPELGRWMKAVGRLTLPPKRPSQFISLSRALISQQLSARAAETITRRCFALAERPGRPRPSDWLSLDDRSLRSAGLSGQKMRYLRALAEAFESGDLRGVRLSRFDDEEIVDRLTEITGIGRWTAEMFLIFDLRRPDVFSPGDLALRKGVARVEGVESLSPRECEEVAARWAPWRSVASLYLWRISHAPEL